MKKIIVTSLAVFAFAFTASAASIPSSFDALFDGFTEFTGEPREKVDVTVRIEADSGEVVHAIGTDLGDGKGEVCHDIRNFEGEQDKNVDVEIELPAITGDYDLDVFVYTADTMQAANALRGDVACSGSYNTDETYYDVIHVVPASDGGTGSSDEPTGVIAQLMALIADLRAQIEALQNPTTPTGPECPPTGVSTFHLQNWLVANGFMTQAEMNTGPGIYGPKTTRAFNQAQWQCSN